MWPSVHILVDFCAHSSIPGTEHIIVGSGDTPEEVAVYFSQDGWRLLNVTQRHLNHDVMLGNFELIGSVGKSFIPSLSVLTTLSLCFLMGSSFHSKAGPQGQLPSQVLCGWCCGCWDWAG